MDTPNMKVKCSVSNCYYWHNNYCTATGLQVNTMGDGYAQTSDGTCCSTFKQKGQMPTAEM